MSRGGDLDRSTDGSEGAASKGASGGVTGSGIAASEGASGGVTGSGIISTAAEGKSSGSSLKSDTL